MSGDINRLATTLRELHHPEQRRLWFKDNKPIMGTVCCRCVERYTDEDSGGNLYTASDPETWPCETIQALNREFPS